MPIFISNSGNLFGSWSAFVYNTFILLSIFSLLVSFWFAFLHGTFEDLNETLLVFWYSVLPNDVLLLILNGCFFLRGDTVLLCDGLTLLCGELTLLSCNVLVSLLSWNISVPFTLTFFTCWLSVLLSERKVILYTHIICNIAITSAPPPPHGHGHDYNGLWYEYTSGYTRTDLLSHT